MNIVPFNTIVKKKMEATACHDVYLPSLLSIKEVCAYLGLGMTTVREMIERREIPHIRIRSRIRVSAKDLKEYLENNRKEV